MHQRIRNPIQRHVRYISTSTSGLKPSNAQLDGMLIITTMSEDFALDMTFGSFVGEESGVSIVCQLVVIGDLFIAQVS